MGVPEVISTGRELLDLLVFVRDDDGKDHERERVARYCLEGNGGKTTVRRLARKFTKAVAEHRTSPYNHGRLVETLMKLHARELIDELFANAQLGHRTVRQMSSFRHNVMASAPDDAVLHWCDEEPAVRYPIAAATATIYTRAGPPPQYQWTELAYKILDRAPEPAAALAEIAHRLAHPVGWTGSLAAKLESRLSLLERLDLARLSGVEAALPQAKAMLRSRVAVERERELDENRADARFE